MPKKCEDCGQFMSLSDEMPQDDAFDTDLAQECGLTDEQIEQGEFDTESEESRFRYVQKQWECSNCGLQGWDTEGPKFYWNPASGWYDGPKPETPKERAERERQAQEAAGQVSLF